MKFLPLFTALSTLTVLSGPAAATGDPIRGARVFISCASCHSVQPGEHMTGPSLASVWNQKAGTVQGFERYSDALQRSGIVWTDANLQRWLAGPEKLIPGNAMTFPGLREKKDQEDIAAFLKAASEGKTPKVQGGRSGDMMMGRARPNLKQAPAEGQITALEYCRGTYVIKTAAGTADKVWEFNVRLKSDSSKDGPLPGKPVVVGSGMQGDRISVVFSSPVEISQYIRQCR